MPAPTNIGGQAVIEGVMMRAAGGLAVAVRRPSGEIVVREQLFTSIGDRLPMLKLPFLRGIVVLVETLSKGLEALAFSAQQVEEKSEKDSESTGPGKLATALTLGLALLFGVGLFVALPHGLTLGVGRIFGELSLQSVTFHLVTGGFKLAIFVSYLGLLSRLPDIRRVFMYHGAEHKVIATHEAGDPLDVEHARRYTTFHARCGTSFLLVVVVAAIVLFALVFPLIPGLSDDTGDHALAIAIKIPLLMPVAGLAYELNRFAANHLDNRLVRLLVTPGFFMQRLTTGEPSDDMLEVALASLKAALRRDAAGVDDEDPVVVYSDFAEICSRLV